MSTIQRISDILQRMSELARRDGSVNVSASLERAAALVARDAREGASAILGMYGGMGSLNDVILYEGNKPLAGENEEFDPFISELFELSQELRT